jgi:hypothetical protein
MPKNENNFGINGPTKIMASDSAAALRPISAISIESFSIIIAKSGSVKPNIRPTIPADNMTHRRP